MARSRVFSAGNYYADREHGLLSPPEMGWWLAVSIFLVNAISDAGQILLGHRLEGSIGVAVAGTILLYLAKPKVRATFT
jgi:hypothetical protein